MTESAKEFGPVHSAPITGRFEEPNDRTIESVAREFSRRIERELSESEMEEVRNQDNSSSCKTHDFCDANMVMDEAVEAVTGESFKLDRTETEQENETALMNQAWSRAREANFNL